MRNQIRIAQIAPSLDDNAGRAATEWMEASLNNRWLLRARLAEACVAHGVESHRLETRSVVSDSHAAQLLTVRPEAGRATVAEHQSSQHPRGTAVGAAVGNWGSA